MNGNNYDYNNPTGAIAMDHRIELSHNNWLSWDCMKLLLNLFLQDGSYNN